MLHGKHVLVVGGSSGIGMEVAAQILKSGANVTVVGRSEAKLHRALTSLDGGSSCQGIACDVSDEQQVSQLYEQVGVFDHLVVTAAGDIVYKPFEEISLHEVHNVVNAKLIGAFLLVKYGKPLMRSGASIVLTSGINAFIPPGRSSIVSAANGALIAFARALAVELGPIRVNTVSPGWVDTPIWTNLATEEEKDTMFRDMAEKLPVRRTGEPSDIAAAVMLLLTNGYITGTTLEVDGGRRLL
jgi:NAD(P)-dependent dehydrogenase (short-subunit alcohol dehydrogenase family)